MSKWQVIAVMITAGGLVDTVWTRCGQFYACLLVNFFLFWIGQNFTQNILQLHKKSKPDVLSLRTFLHADYYPKVGWSVSWCTQTSIIWSHNITKLEWCYAVLWPSCPKPNRWTRSSRNSKLPSLEVKIENSIFQVISSFVVNNSPQFVLGSPLPDWLGESLGDGGWAHYCGILVENSSTPLATFLATSPTSNTWMVLVELTSAAPRS